MSIKNSHNGLRTLGVFSMVLIMSSFFVFFTGCSNEEETISAEESLNLLKDSLTVQTKSSTEPYYGIEILDKVCIFPNEPTHGIPNKTVYKFYAANISDDVTQINIVFEAPDEYVYMNDKEFQMVKAPYNPIPGKSNWYLTRTLKLSGRYNIKYFLKRTNKTTYAVPIPNYVDNTVIDISGSTKKLVWPFGADGSSWKEQYPWKMTCGHGCYMHTGNEYYSQDWNHSNCKGKPFISPLDGIIFKKEQYNGGNILGIRQKIGDTEYYFAVNHLDRFAPGIVVGSYVQAGVTVVGYIGETGKVTGPHAHTQLKVNGVSIPFEFSAR